MEQSKYEQAAYLLKILKIVPEINILSIAMVVVDRYGTTIRVMEEIAKTKYDRLRYTPELLLSSMITIEDASREDAEALAMKLHLLRSLVLHESNISGMPFDAVLEKVDVIKTVSLSLREAWALKFAGGKGFIDNINTYANGDVVLKILIESFSRADEHIKNGDAVSLPTKTRMLNG